MPVARYALSGMARGLRAFLNLEAGVVRDDGISAAQPSVEATIDEQSQEIEHLRQLVSARDRELAGLRADIEPIHTNGVRPEKLIWIFGTGRSGNTWLSDMMEAMGNAVWREPSVGRLFGEFYYLRSRPGQLGTRNYILGEKQRGTWLRSIRSFVLEGASGRFPELGRYDYLVIKEQVGSVGAPLMMEALPESRMIVLIRDPRDVVASWLDASREGGWRDERLDKSDPNWSPVSDEDTAAFIEERANIYLGSVGKAIEAYEHHAGPKVLVRYEDLRADALGTMRHIHATLGIDVSEEELARTVEKHSWENVSAEEKGKGKFRRKAEIGGWHRDLTPEQARNVEEITAVLIEEFYPDDWSRSSR